MTMLFYEVLDGPEPQYFFYDLGPKFFFHPGGQQSSWTRINAGPQKINYRANRIWAWNSNNDTLKYVKNRDDGIMKEVDRKEFLVVQLKSREYRVSDEI